MKVKMGNYRKSAGRKVKIEIDSSDTWNLDYSLALIIYPALLQLRAEKHGIPNDIVNEVGGEDWSSQDSFDFYKESHQEAFNKACERWEQILDKMIWSFEQLVRGDYSDKYHHGDPKYDWIKSKKTFPNPMTGKIEATWQMVDKNPDDHWYDGVGHQLHEDRIQEGLDLFGKYYRALWD
jgi:hypothetical protein